MPSTDTIPCWNCDRPIQKTALGCPFCGADQTLRHQRIVTPEPVARTDGNAETEQKDDKDGTESSQ